MKKIKAKNSFYTLIEVLTVVVIAAILFGIGIPAFTTMIQGNSMTIAVREFSSKISAARAYAITNRCRVALLLVEDQKHPEISTEYFLGDAGRFSAYRVCKVKDTAYEFDGWIEGEDWKTLPSGCIRNGTISGLSDVANIPSLKADGSTPSSALTITLKGIVFKKDGKAESACGPIYLSLGRYVGGGTSPVITDKDGTKDGKQLLTINQYTGKVTTGEFKYE